MVSNNKKLDYTEQNHQNIGPVCSVHEYIYDMLRVECLIYESTENSENVGHVIRCLVYFLSCFFSLVSRQAEAAYPHVREAGTIKSRLTGDPKGC